MTETAANLNAELDLPAVVVLWSDRCEKGFVTCASMDEVPAIKAKDDDIDYIILEAADGRYVVREGDVSYFGIDEGIRLGRGLGYQVEADYDYETKSFTLREPNG